MLNRKTRDNTNSSCKIGNSPRNNREDDWLLCAKLAASNSETAPVECNGKFSNRTNSSVSYFQRVLLFSRFRNKRLFLTIPGLFYVFATVPFVGEYFLSNQTLESLSK